MKFFNPPISLNEGKIEIVSIDESNCEITGMVNFDSTVTIGDHNSTKLFTAYQMNYARKYLIKEGFVSKTVKNNLHFSLTSIIKNNNI